MDTRGLLGRRTAAAAFAMAAICLWQPAARAADTYPPEVENHCRDDYFKYCTPYALGSTELRRCMEAKGQTLSVHCKQALKDAGLIRPGRNRRGG